MINLSDNGANNAISNNRNDIYQKIEIQFRFQNVPHLRYILVQLKMQLKLSRYFVQISLKNTIYSLVVLEFEMYLSVAAFWQYKPGDTL